MILVPLPLSFSPSLCSSHKRALGVCSAYQDGNYLIRLVGRIRFRSFPLGASPPRRLLIHQNLIPWIPSARGGCDFARERCFGVNLAIFGEYPRVNL